jgi:hypothetical protein
MRHARAFPLSVSLLAALFDVPGAGAAIGPAGPLAMDPGPIRARRPVPDDPLAGLPADDGARPDKGKSGTGKSAACVVDARPADGRDIGDLRAALAFAQHGPRSWPCPTRTVSEGIALRIAVDGTGKITTVEPTKSGSDVALAIAKKLAGKSIAPRRAGPTAGSVLLSFTPGKGR